MPFLSLGVHGFNFGNRDRGLCGSVFGVADLDLGVKGEENLGLGMSGVDVLGLGVEGADEGVCFEEESPFDNSRLVRFDCLPTALRKNCLIRDPIVGLGLVFLDVLLSLLFPQLPVLLRLRFLRKPNWLTWLPWSPLLLLR